MYILYGHMELQTRYDDILKCGKKFDDKSQMVLVFWNYVTYCSLHFRIVVRVAKFDLYNINYKYIIQVTGTINLKLINILKLFNSVFTSFIVWKLKKIWHIIRIFFLI